MGREYVNSRSDGQQGGIARWREGSVCAAVRFGHGSRIPAELFLARRGAYRVNHYISPRSPTDRLRDHWCSAIPSKDDAIDQRATLHTGPLSLYASVPGARRDTSKRVDHA